MTRVKICGLTREADVEAAARAGADYLGFVFAEGPRRLSTERGEELALSAREAGFTGGLVGVFANPTIERLADVIERCDLDIVQLHGVETSDFVEKARALRPVWKALSVAPEWTAAELEQAAAEYSGAEALLLDGGSPGRGGSGRGFAHTLAAALVRSRPVVIAGGLKPDSVAAVVRLLRPFAVDVSSGVERSPGVKDARAVAAFVDAVSRLDLAAAEGP